MAILRRWQDRVGAWSYNCVELLLWGSKQVIGTWLVGMDQISAASRINIGICKVIFNWMLRVWHVLGTLVLWRRSLCVLVIHISGLLLSLCIHLRLMIVKLGLKLRLLDMSVRPRWLEAAKLIDLLQLRLLWPEGLVAWGNRAELLRRIRQWIGLLEEYLLNNLILLFDLLLLHWDDLLNLWHLVHECYWRVIRFSFLNVVRRTFSLVFLQLYVFFFDSLDLLAQCLNLFPQFCELHLCITIMYLKVVPWLSVWFSLLLLLWR